MPSASVAPLMFVTAAHRSHSGFVRCNKRVTDSSSDALPGGQGHSRCCGWCVGEGPSVSRHRLWSRFTGGTLPSEPLLTNNTSQFPQTTVVFPYPNRLVISLDMHISNLDDIEVYLGLICVKLATFRTGSRGREVCLHKWFGWKSTTRDCVAVQVIN